MEVRRRRRTSCFRSTPVLAAFVFGLLLPRLAAADPVSPPPAVFSAERDAETYAYCLRLAKLDAAAAQRLAQEWRERGGAHPAEHCAAVALIGIGKYQEAAGRLETLAQQMKAAPAALRAGVLDQAGQAWLLAGDPARAEAAADAAVALQPADPELRIDRAEAAAASGYFDRAVGDLDKVLAADPQRVEALVYRASAYRALGRLDAALADIDAALARDPAAAPALLERGNIRRLMGDIDGARRDWQRVGGLAAGTQADMAARTNLENLTRTGQPTPAAKPAGASR